jgi:hypothetical protein
MDDRYKLLGTIRVPLSGVSQGTVDLGNEIKPRKLVVQAALGTNSGYDLMWLPSAASATDISAARFASAVVGGLFASANQPANDCVEILSSSALDITQDVTLYGVAYGSTTVIKKTRKLNGTNVLAVYADHPGTSTTWGYILGVELSAACAGNVTVQEGSGNAEIVVISAGGTSIGVVNVTAASQGCFDLDC